MRLSWRGLWLPLSKRETVRLEAADEERIHCQGCPLEEIKPEVQSGAPLLRGTRMPVNAIIDNFDCGLSVAEIAEQFEISPERVGAVASYVKRHRVARPV